MPERRGHTLQHWIDRGEGRPCRNDQKWRGHENLGEHDTRERVGEAATCQAAERGAVSEQEQDQHTRRPNRKLQQVAGADRFTAYRML